MPLDSPILAFFCRISSFITVGVKGTSLNSYKFWVFDSAEAAGPAAKGPSAAGPAASAESKTLNLKNLGGTPNSLPIKKMQIFFDALVRPRLLTRSNTQYPRHTRRQENFPSHKRIFLGLSAPFYKPNLGFSAPSIKRWSKKPPGVECPPAL